MPEKYVGIWKLETEVAFYIMNSGQYDYDTMYTYVIESDVVMSCYINKDLLSCTLCHICHVLITETRVKHRYICTVVCSGNYELCAGRSW